MRRHTGTRGHRSGALSEKLACAQGERRRAQSAIGHRDVPRLPTYARTRRRRPRAATRRRGVRHDDAGAEMRVSALADCFGAREFRKLLGGACGEKHGNVLVLLWSTPVVCGLSRSP